MEARRARDRAELERALALRSRVFQDEQGVRRPGDVGRLGWMAVGRAARRRGVGAAILAAAGRSAAGAGARLMQLYAQRQAESFHAGAGYAPCGDPFFAEGIEHVSMEKRLA